MSFSFVVTGIAAVLLVGLALEVPIRHAWMAWMPYLFALLLVASMLLKRELDWRGHTYRLDARARLRREPES